jgi:hypothetical protein
MLDALFTFPVVNIDGDNEERKLKENDLLGDNDLPYDMVFGEAEYPYWDFIGIEDRWLPTTESFNKALDGKFEACMVRFVHAGQLLVPWTRKKFKTEIANFAKEFEESNPQESGKRAELRIMTLTPEQYKKATEDEDGNEG